MEANTAGRAAQGHSRRFFSRWKGETVAWRTSLLIALGLSMLGVIVGWELRCHGVAADTAVTWSLFIPPIVFLISYAIYHAIRVPLLLKIDDASVESEQLKSEIATLKSKHVDELIDDGRFWERHYAQHEQHVWQEGESRWEQYVCRKLRSYYGESKEHAFTNDVAVDSDNDSDFMLRNLRRRLENLSKIRTSFSS
jgi:hypothetical protein